MPVKNILVAVSTGLAGIAGIIAVVGLVHELLTARDPHMLIHSLEEWVAEIGFRVAFIILAAAGVNYLAHKK